MTPVIASITCPTLDVDVKQKINISWEEGAQHPAQVLFPICIVYCKTMVLALTLKISIFKITNCLNWQS